MNNEQSRYELFKSKAAEDINAYRKQAKGDGSFEYVEQVKQLRRLSNQMSRNMLVYLYGIQLGEHLFEKFVNDCQRDFLLFLGKLESETAFFLLYELKNNEQLFYHK